MLSFFLSLALSIPILLIINLLRQINMNRVRMRWINDELLMLFFTFDGVRCDYYVDDSASIS